MKIRFYLVAIFIHTMCFSQKSNAFEFKNISFIKKDSITNLKEYKNSVYNQKTDFLGAPYTEEDKKKMIASDSLYSQKELDKFTTIFYYKKINDSIIERSTDKDPYSDSSIFINTKIGREFYDYPYPAKDFSYKIPFENIKDLKIQELKKEKKIIKGVKCFKIKVSYTVVIIFDKKNEFPGLKVPDKIMDFESEMWVTEKIKSIYHPAFKIREILEKYYPLEIKEKNNSRKGIVRIIRIQNFETN